MKSGFIPMKGVAEYQLLLPKDKLQTLVLKEINAAEKE